jgi:UDP:flavonoid glycosyltransferase YjiC (YdhE family)
VFPQVPLLSKLRFLGPTFHGLFFRCAKWSARSWFEPWHRLRAELGLPPTSYSPLFEGQHSASLVLALFSKLLADRQPDWPPQTVITGFPLYDGGLGLPPELVDFLGEGPPPIVFTLGSSGEEVAGPFYEHSVAAAKRLGRRAVLIVGKNSRHRPAPLPDGVVACDYAPFSELFPRAAVIVHAGGIGTTGLAMRSGRPMLVVPYAHDQFDNAARATRLGIARTIPQRRYLPQQVAAELGQLLNNPLYAGRASSLGERIGREDGVRLACDALEGLLGASGLARRLCGDPES